MYETKQEKKGNKTGIQHLLRLLSLSLRKKKSFREKSSESFRTETEDSNPRAPEGKRISSAPRYDRFDTSPYNIMNIFLI